MFIFICIQLNFLRACGRAHTRTYIYQLLCDFRYLPAMLSAYVLADYWLSAIFHDLQLVTLLNFKYIFQGLEMMLSFFIRSISFSPEL